MGYKSPQGTIGALDKVDLETDVEGELPSTNVAVPALKSNAAEGAPTAEDDEDAGYAPGSVWVDTATGATYVCVDATAEAAVWRRNPKNNAAAGAPTADDDEAAGYGPGDVWVDTSGPTVYVCADATEEAAVWVELLANEE